MLHAALTLAIAGSAFAAGPYESTWESLDSRPNPQWFEDAKFGIFIIWGAYSVPAWGPKDRYSEWYALDMTREGSPTREFHRETYGKDLPFTHFPQDFHAELFDPDEWAALFERAGAKYVVMTAKHHSGYCMWPSADAWNWNSADTGPQRDLVGDVAKAVRNTDLRFGLYYSLYEWFNPLYENDLDRYVDQHMLPQFKDLVQRYRPAVIWPDGEWDHPSSTWRSTEFLAWLFNESNAPEDVAINDRWGSDSRAVHGGFATPEYQHVSEGPLMDAGQLEECQGMGKSFGYNRNEAVDDYRSTDELLTLLLDTVSRGGNLLLAVGPTADGRIPVIMQQRLVDMGTWLEVNGEAVYGSRRWRQTKEGESVRYTTKDGTVYAICLDWPGKTLRLEAPTPTGNVQVSMLGYDDDVVHRFEGDALVIDVPQLTPDVIPCQHAYVFRLEGVE